MQRATLRMCAMRRAMSCLPPTTTSLISLRRHALSHYSPRFFHTSTLCLSSSSSSAVGLANSSTGVTSATILSAVEAALAQCGDETGGHARASRSSTTSAETHTCPPLTPVILVLLDAALVEAELSHVERRRQRQSQYARRGASQAEAASGSAPQTLYEQILFSSSSDVCYASAPWLFRRLMRLAATFPAGHVCKEVIASTYTWTDFEAVLRLMEVYTLTESGLERLEMEEDGEEAEQDEEAGEETATAADGAASHGAKDAMAPTAMAALKHDVRTRFWTVCSPVAPEVLRLSGVGVSSATTSSVGPDASATAASASVDASHAIDARRFYMARRRADTYTDAASSAELPPLFSQSEPISWRCPSTMPAPDASNNFNGWGSPVSIPRPEDVQAILAYIPVNWGNFGTLDIPPEVRKRHMRSSAPLQWFRRQPFYFELRDMNGTNEVRRGIALHPEAHGLTRDAALARVQLLMAERSLNHLVPLLPSGAVAVTPASSSSSGASRAVTRHGDGAAAAATTVLLPAERAALKFFRRVCPAYFTTFTLVVQRATKKSVDEALLQRLARDWPGEFEVWRSRYSDVGLVRRRGLGADASRWRSAFLDDVERVPEDVEGMLAVMDVMCALWDRPEYVFVRLSALAQRRVGGYAGLLAMMRRHPQVFRCGVHYVRRVDLSDPLSQQQAEPALGDSLSRTYLREENPYLSPREIAKVFHYVAPDDEPFTPAFLVERASPAMQIALPPRVITLLQLFPEWFACTETAPGAFSVHKICPSPSRFHEDGTPVASAARDNDRAKGEESEAGEDGEEDHSWMRDASAEEGTLLSATGPHTAAPSAGTGLSRPATVAAVRVLVPRHGVDSAQLLLWAPLPVQRAASQYFGGVLKLVEAEKTVFRVEEGPDASQRIFLREPDETR